MATVLRKTHPLASVIATAHNSLKAQIGAGSSFHLDKSEQIVTAADASSLATALTLCNQLAGVLLFHFADDVGHKVADDASSLPAVGDAVDLASAIVAANAMKAEYNTHRASTTEHYNADATNAVAASDASDQGSLETLLNEIKLDLNAHMASGPAAASIRLIDA